MNLVAFDTSTEACSVAISIDGEVTYDHRIVKQEHAALLLPMLSGLLAATDVSAMDIQGVVFGQGPGSFTGVRIAAATAQGLAVAAHCGVQGVSSLQAIASAAVRAQAERAQTMPVDEATTDKVLPVSSAPLYVTAAIDARMMGSEAVLAAEDWVVPSAVTLDGAASGAVILSGSGAERYSQVLSDTWRQTHHLEPQLQPGVYPHALDILALADTGNDAQWLEPQHAQPVYLRNKVALTEAERASG